MLLAYLSYPYSINPKKTTEEATTLAKEIMLRNKHLAVIVPHTSVPNGGQELAVKVIITLLRKVDLLILGTDLDPDLSVGMIWEKAFMDDLNSRRNKQIVIIKACELLNG